MNDRIMLVDDDTDLRESVIDALTSHGYEVDPFEEAGPALERLRSGPPPVLVLLDLMLVGMDGFEFRRLQLADPRIADVPVVLVSGTGDVAAIASVLHAAGYLRKPFDLTALLSVIAQARKIAQT